MFSLLFPCGSSIPKIYKSVSSPIYRPLHSQLRERCQPKPAPPSYSLATSGAAQTSLNTVGSQALQVSYFFQNTCVKSELQGYLSRRQFHSHALTDWFQVGQNCSPWEDSPNFLEELQRSTNYVPEATPGQPPAFVLLKCHSPRRSCSCPVPPQQTVTQGPCKCSA